MATVSEPKIKTLLVCGGRDYADGQCVRLAIMQVNPERVIHGGAKGADTLARAACHTENIPCEAYPADWDKYGKRAGFIRNAKMLQDGKPDMVLAFPGGSGTAHMVRLAEQEGIPVRKIT